MSSSDGRSPWSQRVTSDDPMAASISFDTWMLLLLLWQEVICYNCGIPLRSFEGKAVSSKVEAERMAAKFGIQLPRS